MAKDKGGRRKNDPKPGESKADARKRRIVEELKKPGKSVGQVRNEVLRGDYDS